MIPNSALPDDSQLVPAHSPTLTYKLDPNSKRIKGMIDGVDAMAQMIYKVLHTERYAYLIYNWDYGMELEQYLGEDTVYVIADIELSITEALMVDDRVIEVKDFILKLLAIDSLYVEFVVSTTEGKTKYELEVPV